MKAKYSVSSLLVLQAAGLLCGCKKSELPYTPTKNEDGKYNIVFITTDQEAYMKSYPQGSDYAARERLKKTWDHI